MTENFMNTLINEAIASVDIRLVLILLCIGFLIKHTKKLEKLQNDLIPPILFVVSCIITIITNGMSLASITIACVTAATSIGIHQSGKNIFTVSVGPRVVELIKKYMQSSLIKVVSSQTGIDIPEELFEEENVDEVVEEENIDEFVEEEHLDNEE